MQELINQAKTGKLKVIIKPNSKNNSIIGYDETKKAFKIEIKQPAQDNKANLELIRFLKKEYGLPTKILKGMSSKEKILRVENEQ